MVFEIRWHGRGGQGAVTGAIIVGEASSIHGGNYAQAIPSFGTERRGAPIEVYNRISNRHIKRRSHIYTPDCVVVLDNTLLEAVNVEKGLKEDGFILINSPKKAEYTLTGELATYKIDAKRIALDILGVPIVNTAMTGALSKVLPMLSLDFILKAIRNNFDKKLAKKNEKIARLAYQELELENNG